jgi:hypothetical protein
LPLLVVVVALLVPQVGLHQMVLQLVAVVTLLYRPALEHPQVCHGQMQYHWRCHWHLLMVPHLLLLLLLLRLLIRQSAQCL